MLGFSLTPEAIHVASVVLAFFFIFFRPTLRKARGRNPAWLKAHVIHDFVSGLTLPTFFAMIYSVIQPEIIAELSHHVLAVAGGIGILTIFTEVLSNSGLAQPDV